MLTNKDEDKDEVKITKSPPRCRRCQQPVHSTTDRSKPSQLVEWMGQDWTKTKPTFIPFYPCGEFPELCNYCKNVLDPPKVGKKS
jgi:hypothetical protein